MKAAVLTSPGRDRDRPLRVQEVSRPERRAGQVLMRVLACGVCRTDLHIVEGELKPLRTSLIPGHQIVGEIIEGGTFDYDRLLWGERQIRSVANMTRADARDFLKIAAEMHLQPKITTFALDQANEALAAIKNDSIDGAAVILP